jgi:hypothetical protein
MQFLRYLTNTSQLEGSVQAGHVLLEAPLRLIVVKGSHRVNREESQISRRFHDLSAS